MKRIEGKGTDKTEVLRDHKWQMYRFIYYVYAKQMTETFELNSVDGLMKGQIGDWIVMDRKGNRRLVSGSLFDEAYEKY